MSVLVSLQPGAANSSIIRLEDFSANHSPERIKKQVHLSMAGYLAAPAAGTFHEHFFEFYINKDFVLGFHDNPEMQRVVVDPPVS